MKDAALNQAYRTRFQSCHMKYSLAVPFKRTLSTLAIHPDGTNTTPAGFVGMITANSFMKREFGKKLIEEFYPPAGILHTLSTRQAHSFPATVLPR